MLIEKTERRTLVTKKKVQLINIEHWIDKINISSLENKE